MFFRLNQTFVFGFDYNFVLVYILLTLVFLCHNFVKKSLQMRLDKKASFLREESIYGGLVYTQRAQSRYRANLTVIFNKFSFFEIMPKNFNQHFDGTYRRIGRLQVLD